MTGAEPLSGLSPDVRAVLEAVEESAAGAPVALVGGALRDLVLGVASPRDLDVVVVGGDAAVEAVARALGRRQGFVLQRRYERFGTASLSAPFGIRLDLAMARVESYPKPGGLPVVRAAPQLADDLARRDFTIHAFAVTLAPGGRLGEVVDPFGGRRDLAERILRLLHPGSLADDPTRALRAADYAAALGFTLGSGFREALDRSRAEGSWRNVSGDRLRRGLELILVKPTAPSALELLRAWGVLDDVVPGWGAVEPASGPRTTWAALLGRASGTVKDAVARRLSFSRRLRLEVAA